MTTKTERRKGISHAVLPESVLRLAGDGTPEATESYSIGHWLRTSCYRVSSAGKMSECDGLLLCLPIDDGVFGLQLAYRTEAELDVYYITCLQVHPQFLAQWPVETLGGEAPFRPDHTAEYELHADATTPGLLQSLAAVAQPANFDSSLHLMEKALGLLRRAVAQVANPFAVCAVPACRFLLYESEREKIYTARSILDTSFDERMTIKALAQKVAMNECYLKKGFKTLVGCTIHEYIAGRRIAAARQMLEAEGRTVTEAAALLGYSSIAHFSTAFKRATGLKPCELIR